MKRRTILVALLSAVAGGCALQPADSHQAGRLYDLGTIAGASAACSVPMDRIRVHAPAHLQGTRMWYRYDDNPYETTAYVISRWASPPRELVKQRLQWLVQPVGGPQALTLEIEITRLELALDAAGNARSSLGVIARVHRQEQVVGQRVFRLLNATDASPAGAASGIARAVDELGAGVCAWLETDLTAPSSVHPPVENPEVIEESTDGRVTPGRSS